jgi:tetratricopeptide (TPR) repeat protein
MAAAQPAASTFPLYDAASANAWGTPSHDPKWAGTLHSDDSGRWDNISPAEQQEPARVRPVSPEPISTDELRHPLTGKALKLIRKAEGLIASHDYAQAREELQKAAKDRAAAPYAHSLLGQEYLRNAQFADAVTELKTAIFSLPSSVPDHANLGYALLMTGQPAAAEQELRRALELQPSNPRTHLALALVCFLDRSRDRETEEHLEFAARELPAAHLMLAKLYRAAGRAAASEREFQMFLQSPNIVNAAAARSWLDGTGSDRAAR